MNKKPIIWIALSLCACTARTPASPSPTAAVGLRSEALVTKLDLVSASTCKAQNGKLLSCVIAPQNLAADLIDTAVPLRTTVVSNKSGNCSTQFPLQVDLSADGEPPVTFPFLGQPKAVVRRHDGGAMAQVSLRDSSSYTKFAAFDASCSVGLSITPNEIDVDSKDAAQAIIDQLTADLTAKNTLRDRYNQLLLFSQAFTLMQKLATSMLVQLTNDEMQELRSSAIDADSALISLILNCGDGLSDDERTNLMRLYASLGALGRPDDWKNADGSTKTLADFLGPDAAKIIDTVNKLAGQADGSLGATYEQEYQQAATDAATADAKLKLAKVQLAGLLGS